MRPRVLCILLAFVFGSLLAASSAGGAVVYGANQNGQIVAIDLVAGSTVVAGTLLFGTQAIDQDPASGYVYYFERTASGDQFARWNPVTGANTVVRTYVPPPGYFVKRMAFAPDGTLYMMDHVDRLYRIDKANGDIVPLGKVRGLVTGSFAGTGDMAFAPDGTLYLVTYRNLYTVNIATRWATLLYANLLPPTAGTHVFSGLAYCDGALYASDLDESILGSSVMRIDPETGAVSASFLSGVMLNDLSSCSAGGPGGVVPTAAFAAAPTAGSAPLSVAFTDASSGSPTQWEWDFQNDGVVDSTVRNPLFTYTSPGVYSVKLTVSNAQGSDAEVRTGLIAVSAPPPTTTFLPQADAYVTSSNPTGNFGSATTLRARPGVVSHLKFAVSGTGGTSRVTLRLFVTDATAGTVSAYRVAGTSWSESSITWNTAPAVGELLGSTAAAATGAWVEIDLGTIPGDGTYGLALQNPATDVVWFSSRQGANPPQLVVAPF